MRWRSRLIQSARGRDNRRVLGPAQVNAKATTHTMRGNDPAALMRAIWKKHSLPYARPHDLRRTAATLVQSAVLPDRPMKWSVEEVGWLLGHRNEKGGPEHSDRQGSSSRRRCLRLPFMAQRSKNLGLQTVSPREQGCQPVPQRSRPHC